MNSRVLRAFGFLAFGTFVAGRVLAQPPAPGQPTSQPIEAETVSVGTLKLAGRDIGVKLPKPTSPLSDPSAIEFEGWRYTFNPDGSLRSRFLVDGAGGDLAALWTQANTRITGDPKIPTWRVRAFLVTRAEIVEKSRDGLYRPRRGTLEPSQVTRGLEALARFKAMAEAATGGAVQMKIDASIDDDPIRATVAGPGEVFGPEWLRERFRVHVNQSAFEADDKVYRGPFDSVVVIHPGLVDPSGLTTIGGAPAASVPYYSSVRPPFDLAQNLYRAWIEQVLWTAQDRGFPALSNGTGGIEAFITPSMWPVLTSHAEPDAEFAARKWFKPTNGESGWAATWAPLPRLDSTTGGVGVPLWAADMVAKRTGAKVLGWTQPAGSAPLIVFASSSGSVAAMLGATPPTTLPNNSKPLTTFGHYRTAKVADVEKGNVLEVSELGAFRQGVGVVTDEPIGDPASTPFLEFWIKTNSAEPFAIVSSRGVVAEVNPSEPWPTELSSPPANPQSVFVRPDNTWQKVSIDLRKSTLTPGLLESLALAPTAVSYYRERQLMDPAKWLVTGFTLVATASSDASTAQGLPANPVLDRAKQAAEISSTPTDADKAVLLERLKDPNDLVRLNAAATMSRLKWPEAIPLLIDQSRSATPAVADFAMRGLAFQDTDESWAALLQLAVKGPFDHNRQFAARELMAKAEPLTAASLSTLMTCRSPQARETAARSLGKIKDKDAGIILMAMLMESDPNVRLAVVEGANVALELVNRRLLWSAVNDPSEFVRLTSYQRLIESPIADYRSEALKGVRDESKAIRLGLLAAMTAKPDPNYRSALRLAVTDASAEVRAAALSAFAALPGVVELAEIENTFADKDPRVQLALVSLAKAKGLKLPESALTQLRSSISEEVVRIARDLGS
ncbi:MAG: HEAT repeat domain-containing protein [Fimbriimonadaceae bacterium]|nr:HEAT repeat domain-containing protein [Fimbriimonadaceae bacterium]